MTVGFELDGTALYGVDYGGIGATYNEATGKWTGFMTFAQGETHLWLNVLPVVDDEIEDTETVILTLLPTSETDENGEPLYRVGDLDTATGRP